MPKAKEDRKEVRRMNEKIKKLISNMKIKLSFLGKDLERLERTLEGVKKNE